MEENWKEKKWPIDSLDSFIKLEETYGAPDEKVCFGLLNQDGTKVKLISADSEEDSVHTVEESLDRNKLSSVILAPKELVYVNDCGVKQPSVYSFVKFFNHKENQKLTRHYSIRNLYCDKKVPTDFATSKDLAIIEKDMTTLYNRNKQEAEKKAAETNEVTARAAYCRELKAQIDDEKNF